jgi:hypothetical protein
MWKATRPFAIKTSDFPCLSNNSPGASNIQPLSFAKTAAQKQWLNEDEVYVDTIANGVPDGWVRIPLKRGKFRYIDYGKPSEEFILFEKNTADFSERLKKKCANMEYKIILDNYINSVNSDIYLNGIDSVYYGSIGMDEQNIINNVSVEIVYSSDSEASVIIEETQLFLDDKHI